MESTRRLERINDASDRMRRGESIRSVVRYLRSVPRDEPVEGAGASAPGGGRGRFREPHPLLTYPAPGADGAAPSRQVHSARLQSVRPARKERAVMGVLTLLRTGKGPMDGWIARAYDQGVQAAFRDVFPALVEDLVAGLQGIRRGLDVGCGPGQFTILAAERLPETEVWGIDLAPTMIELARRHAAESPAADRLHFEVADVATLPFPEGHFDAVISSGSIKHWPDQRSALREIHRVLMPGGRVFIGEMNRLAPPEAIASQRVRLRHWLFRAIYPRVFTKALSPEEARAVFAASPFGAPTRERLLLGGVFWLFEGRKGAA